MRCFELPRAAAMPAPLLDELAVLVELDHASVALAFLMSVGDKDVSCGRDDDCIGLMQGVRTVARHPWFPKRSQQLAAAVELQHVIPNALSDVTVGDPQVIGLVDKKAVREQQLCRAKCLDELAVRVEFHDRVELAAGAIIRTASINDPDMALLVDSHRRAG